MCIRDSHMPSCWDYYRLKASKTPRRQDVKHASPTDRLGAKVDILSFTGFAHGQAGSTVATSTGFAASVHSLVFELRRSKIKSGGLVGFKIT